MRMKQFVSIFLAVALVVGCLGWAPASAQQTKTDATPDNGLSAVMGDTQTESQTQTAQKISSIDIERFSESNHADRLHAAEGSDLYKLVYLNKDGSRTMYLYDYPVKYVDHSGKVQDISLEIADTGNVEYPFRTKANSAVTTFPASLSDGIILSRDDVSIRLVAQIPTAGKISNTAAALNYQARRIDEKTIAYTYDTKTSIEYSLTYTGFKEDILVNSYTGQTEYNFMLYTNGLTLTELDGSFYLADDAGNIQASIGDVIVFTADERNNTFGEMRAETIKPKQIYALTIVLDAEYLTDPKTVYPIRIDPTISLTYAESGANAIDDVTLHSTSTSNGGRTFLLLGMRPSGGVSRILMKFPGIDFSAYAGVTITSATISLRDLMCESSELGMACYPFTGSDWEESTAAWDTVTQSWGELLDRHVISYSNGTAIGWRYSFEIKEAVQKWVDGDHNIVPEKGILFKADDSIENSSELESRTLGSFERDSYKPIFTMTYQCGITLSHDSVTMYPDETLELSAITAPAGQAVRWLSSDSTVASVSETGVVMALSDGNATITATLEDGATAQCEIEVVEKTIAFTSSNVNVYIGKPTILHVRTTPDGEPVQWTSLNPSIATVTNGIVTGINIGQATIRAEIGNGASAECIVNVSSMSISLDYTNIEIYAGDPFTLKATVIPPEQEVAWESDDENIATVSNGVVTGKGTGQTVIRAVIDEEIYAECTVTVLSKSITLNYQNVYLLKGESFTLRATTVPEGANVTWRSDDNNIATVVNGYVTCKNAGQTVIRAIINETTYATCTVNISPSQLYLNHHNTSVAVGDYIMLVANVKPSHLSVTWTSSDETVATVSYSGIVRGHKIGDAVITASLEDGTSVNCIVKVRCVGTLNYSSQNIVEGNSFYLTLSTETPIDIVWQSSDTNIATVDAQGRVFAMNPGVVEITANSSSLLEPVSCTVNVRLMESIYVIKNFGSNLWLTAKDYGIFPDTLVIQEENQSNVNIAASLSQYWKICYLENGYYSIRPAHKLNLCLFATDDGQIVLTDLNTDTDSDSLPTGAQWSITVTPTGYILKSQAHLNNPIMPQGASEDPGMQVICGTQSGSGDASLWSIYGVTVAPRVLLYDATTGEYLETTRVGVVYDEYTSIADMNIAISVVRNTGLYQGITWTCSDPDAVYFYGDGSIVGQKCGKVTVTATPYGSRNSISVTYTLVISKIKTYGDELEYEDYRWNTDYIQPRTNCYAYALNNQIDPYGQNFGCNHSNPDVKTKQAPGDFHNSNLSPNESKVNFTGYGENHCLLIDAVAADFEKYNEIFGTNLIFRGARRDERCPDGTYKVALFIDITTDSQGADFHWFRQDSDGMWSHKPASDPVTRLDFGGNLIYDIEDADTGKYTEFVGYFMVSAWNHMYPDPTLLMMEMRNNTSYCEATVELIVQSNTFFFGHQLFGVPNLEHCKGDNNGDSRFAASSIRRKVYEKNK